MQDWMQTAIVVACGVLALLFLLRRYLWRKPENGSSACGSCGGCSKNRCR